MTQRISARLHFEREGDFCQIRVHNLGSGFPLHSHDYTEMVIVLDGRAEHMIGEKTYPVSSGDVYVIQGNQEHGFRRTAGDFRVCNVMYRPELFDFSLDRLGTMSGYQALFVLEPARRQASGFRSLMRLDSAHLKEVMEKIHRLRLEMDSRPPGFECTTQAYLLDLIVFLSRLYSKSPGTSDAGLVRFSEAVAWMEENFIRRSTVADLARRAAMSERHFLRMFRKTFGISPLEQLIQLRIRHSAELLQSGRYNVTEAAYRSGFSDGNYFSRQFSRVMGMPPRQYRTARKIN